MYERRGEWDSILEGSPPYKIYRELSKETNSRDYDIYCNRFKHEGEDVRKLCRKIARNLKKLPEIEKVKEESPSNRCVYLNFWTQEELRNTFHDKWEHFFEMLDSARLLDVERNINNELEQEYRFNNSKEINKDVSALLETDDSEYYTLTNYKYCFYYINGSSDECKEMKDLFDYFKSYDHIKANIASMNEHKFEIYDKYLTYINKLYEKHKNNCCYNSTPWNYCVDYYNCQEKYNPNNFINDLMEKKKKLGKEENTERVKFRGENENLETSNSGDNIEFVNFISQKRDNRVLKFIRELKYVDEKPGGGNKSEFIDAQSKPQKGYLYFLDSFSNNSIAVVAIIGTCLVFFVIYKFTPFGCWLRKKVLKKKDIPIDSCEQNVGDSLDHDIKDANVTSTNT
ncbi:PIR Superfamily Protein [Plasmodium ovale wallikeri]|uniref:PIR Superfamily Protein n=1 Tax=Plasmodium ovale wallikeri TaxID=864142 RepID=A0A1A9AM24_PLAOA|nr:PIR Superfamily Protein [Plasmodium ovale wallikeri]SBT57244.1 PIR Superfamily Protein [Plasmodium ovale wallikeri]